MTIPRFVALPSFPLEHRYAPDATYVHEADRRDCLGLVLHADAAIRSIVDGRETLHHARAGMVGVMPADHARHTVVVSPRRPTAAFLLLVPPSAVAAIARTEGIDCGAGLRTDFACDDRQLADLLRTLRDRHRADPSAPAADGLARDAILRAIELATGRRPGWWSDTSTFDKPTMERIVAFIDDHLPEPLLVADVAAVTGLSPSHFERRFRTSTGMSVMRFRNGRRVGAALGRLQAAPESLATLARTLGFCSQSHFTSTFRVWTGMTPLRYTRAVHAPRTRGGGRDPSRRGGGVRRAQADESPVRGGR